MLGDTHGIPNGRKFRAKPVKPVKTSIRVTRHKSFQSCFYLLFTGLPSSPQLQKKTCLQLLDFYSHQHQDQNLDARLTQEGCTCLVFRLVPSWRAWAWVIRSKVSKHKINQRTIPQKPLEGATEHGIGDWNCAHFLTGLHLNTHKMTHSRFIA